MALDSPPAADTAPLLPPALPAPKVHTVETVFPVVPVQPLPGSKRRRVAEPEASCLVDAFKIGRPQAVRAAAISSLPPIVVVKVRTTGPDQILT